MLEFNEGDNIRVQASDGWHVVTVKSVIPDPDGFGATLTFSHIDGEPISDPIGPSAPDPVDIRLAGLLDEERKA